jgi:thioredoxin reductase (NADPH)
MIVRRLEVPGVEALTGAGVYYGGALSEAASCRGADVVILGGANSAGQAALLFSRYARTVTILVRAESLHASMSAYLIDRIEAADNIEVVSRTTVAGACGTTQLEAIDLLHADTGERRTLRASAMFIFIGAVPQSEMVAGLVERDDLGFVLTGPDLLREGKRPKGWPLEDPFLLKPASRASLPPATSVRLRQTGGVGGRRGSAAVGSSTST